MALKFLTILAFVGACYAYPTGAPLQACESMIPHHGVEAQKSPSPFTAKVDVAEVKSDDIVKIAISGSGDSDFKGYLIEVRDKDGTAVGSFQPSSDYQTMDCFGNTDSAATHVSSKLKTSATLTWKAPSKSGKYTIHLTVVKDYSTFWYTKTDTTITVA